MSLVAISNNYNDWLANGDPRKEQHESTQHNRLKVGHILTEFLGKVFLNFEHPFNADALLDCAFALFGYTQTDGLLAPPGSLDAPQLKQKCTALEQIDSAFRVNASHFKILKQIGNGAYGDIHLVQHILTNELLALKTMKKIEMIRKSNSASFWEERNIMLLANSEWIVKLHYAFQDSKYIYMAMDFVPGGDMVSLMSRLTITEEMTKFYSAEMALAISALHDMGYIHRDIKPDNILIDALGHVKLADFGTCIKADEDGLIRNDTAIGTPDYICPEVLHCQGKMGTFGKEIDWWSLGIIVYELMVGDTPFFADSLVGTYSRIMTHVESLKFPNDIDISDSGKHFICSLLTDQSQRLGVNGLVEIQTHAFFDDVDWSWDNIRQMQPPFVPKLSERCDTRYFDEFDLSGQQDSVNGDYDTGEINQTNCPPVNNQEVQERIDHKRFIGFTFTKDFLIVNNSQSHTERKVNNAGHRLQVNLCGGGHDPIPGSTETAKCLIRRIQEPQTEGVERPSRTSDSVRQRRCSQMLRQRRGESFCIGTRDRENVYQRPRRVDSSSHYEGFVARNSFEHQCKTDSADSAISTASQSSGNEFRAFSNGDCDDFVHPKDSAMYRQPLNHKSALRNYSEHSADRPLRSLEKDLEAALVRVSHLSDLVEHMQTARALNERRQVMMSAALQKALAEKAAISQQLLNVELMNVELIASLKSAKMEMDALRISNEELVQQNNSINACHCQIEMKYLRLCEDFEHKGGELDNMMQQVSILRRGLHEQQIIKKEAVRKLETLLQNPLEIPYFSKNTGSENRILHHHRIEKQYKKLEQSIINERHSWQREEDRLNRELEFKSGRLRNAETSISRLRKVIEYYERSCSKSAAITRVYSGGKYSSLDRKLSCELQGNVSSRTHSVGQGSTIVEHRDDRMAVVNASMVKRLNGNCDCVGYCSQNNSASRFNFKQLISQDYSHDKWLLGGARPLDSPKRSQEADNEQLRSCGPDDHLSDLRETFSFNYSEKRTSRMMSEVVKSQAREPYEACWDELEGWLQLPCKHNMRKSAWCKYLAVCKSGHLSFFESNKSALPILHIPINLLYHVRAVTTHDAMRVDASLLPNIFQIMYNSSVKTPKNIGFVSAGQNTPVSKGLLLTYKHHSFMVILYRKSTICNYCKKSCSGLINPPTSVECTKCHYRCHKSHVDAESDLDPCQIQTNESMNSLLVLCPSQPELTHWLRILTYNIQHNECLRKH